MEINTDVEQTTDSARIHPIETEKKSGKPKGGKRPGAGRPPNPNKINVPAAQFAKLVLPQLPSGRNAKPEVFLQWWTDLTPDELTHLVVYVYRKWPTWDAKRFNPKAQTNIRVITGPCPFSVDHWDRDVMHEFGSGDYSFSVNEDSIHRWDVSFKGLRDFDNYPPLLDTRLIMMDDPANKSYVDWLRVRGRLNEFDVKETEDSMANNEALNRSLDMNERMTNTVIELSTAAAQRPAPADSRSIAELRGMELVQEGAKETISFMRETMSDITRSQNANADPLVVVEKVVTLVNAMNGNNKGDDKMSGFMQRMLDQADKRNDALQEELREMRRDMERKRNSTEDGEGMSGGFLGQLKGLGEIKNVLSDLGIIKLPNPDGSSDEQSESTGKSGSLKTALLEQAFKQLPQMIGPGGINGLIGNIVAGIQAARGLQQIQQTAQVNGQAQQPIQNGQSQIQPNPIQSAPVQQQPALSNGFPPPPVSGMPDIDGPLLYVWKVAPTLLHHMNSADLSGYTFARWLIDSDATGRQQYDIMKEAGAVNVKALLEAYPALWDVLSKTPVKLDKFLTEMLRLDEWEVEQEAGGDEGDEEEEELLIAAVAGKK